MLPYLIPLCIGNHSAYQYSVVIVVSCPQYRLYWTSGHFFQNNPSHDSHRLLWTSTTAQTIVTDCESLSRKHMEDTRLKKTVLFLNILVIDHVHIGFCCCQGVTSSSLKANQNTDPCLPLEMYMLEPVRETDNVLHCCVGQF